MSSEQGSGSISDLLESWYRQRAGLVDAKVSNFATPASGVVNETYTHTVSYLHDSKRVSLPAVLRIQPATSDTPIPNVDVIEQAFVLSKLSNVKNLLTPDVLWQEPDARWLGRPFYLMERMRGAAVFDEGTVPDDPTMLRSMYQQAVSMLARIHAVDWRGAGLQAMYCGSEARTPLRARLDQYRAHLEAASEIKKYPLLETALEWLFENSPTEILPVLNWGDARPGNLLYEGAELTAVLDWEIADITAREVDMGWFIFFERFLRKNAATTRPGAMSDEEIVTCYEQHAGVELGDLDYFQRWASFRLAIMRLRAGQSAIKCGLEPPESRIDEINYATIELAQLFGLPEPE